MANGVWQLRATAWDLAGRTSGIDARLVIDTAGKSFDAHTVNDALIRLGGHTLALNRVISAPFAVAGDADQAARFGNWQMPLLDSALSTDQPATLESGASPGNLAPWREGARVWLSVPADLADPQAGYAHLRFTLGTVAGGSTAAGAPRVWNATFGSDQGWTLEARSEAAGDDNAPAEALVREGVRLYSQRTGLPWVPATYTLIGPDGTRHSLDARGHITRVRFADGQDWLVSDAGVAAVTDNGIAERLDLLRDSQGRITRVLYPDAEGESTALAYRYDTGGRLTLARALGDIGLGTPVAYDAAGRWFTDPISAHFGAATQWSANNTWNGTLAAGSDTTLAFAVRESEIASTLPVAGGQGAVLVVLETDAPADAVFDISGAQRIGQQTSAGTSTHLLRVTEAGVKLVRIHTTSGGSVRVRLALAGDLNADGEVNGADSALWEQAQATANAVGDINGDGIVDRLDRQLLFANRGFQANRAPLSAANPPTIQTHRDLAGQTALGRLAEDREGDTVFWRVLGATHGSARLAADGQTLGFTPEAGYAGEAVIRLQADDGFAAGAPIEVKVNVSGARLLSFNLQRLATLSSGSASTLIMTGNFEDEQNVRLIGNYAHYSSTDQTIAQVDELGRIHALQEGTTIIKASAQGLDEFNVVTVGLHPEAPRVCSQYPFCGYILPFGQGTWNGEC